VSRWISTSPIQPTPVTFMHGCNHAKPCPTSMHAVATTGQLFSLRRKCMHGRRCLLIMYHERADGARLAPAAERFADTADWLFMRAARRLIMSQSTFAWWAAFLGNATEIHYPVRQCLSPGHCSSTPQFLPLAAQSSRLSIFHASIQLPMGMARTSLSTHLRTS